MGVPQISSYAVLFILRGDCNLIISRDLQMAENIGHEQFLCHLFSQGWHLHRDICESISIQD